MNVKLHFESHLDYQLEAIDAVCDLFKGQESTSQSAFTVCGGLSLEPQIWDSSRGQMIQQGYLSSIGQEEGIGNRLCLVESELLDNLHQVQEREPRRTRFHRRNGDGNRQNIRVSAHHF